MAVKTAPRPVGKPRLAEPITSLVVFGRDRSRGSALGEFSVVPRRGRWVVFPDGDAVAHQVSVLANLTGLVVKTKGPVFSLVRSVVKDGLPREAFARVRAAIGATTEQLASIAGVPSRTVARRTRFKPDESERILRVASAFQRALELFEDLDEARRWFGTPQRALGGLSPFACCDTEAGATEVERLVGRIETGVFN